MSIFHPFNTNDPYVIKFRTSKWSIRALKKYLADFSTLDEKINYINKLLEDIGQYDGFKTKDLKSFINKVIEFKSTILNNDTRIKVNKKEELIESFARLKKEKVILLTFEQLGLFIYENFDLEYKASTIERRLKYFTTL